VTIHAVELKERIAISDDYTPEERDLILDAINFYLHHLKTDDRFNYRSLPMPSGTMEALGKLPKLRHLSESK
jgi:hypothetical protein